MTPIVRPQFQIAAVTNNIITSVLPFKNSFLLFSACCTLHRYASQIFNLDNSITSHLILSCTILYYTILYYLVSRIVNTAVSGAGALVFGYCYSNMQCVDSELLLKKGDIKLRAIVTLKCFVSGESTYLDGIKIEIT